MKALLNAWNGLKRYVQDARIDADFKRCERTLIAAHAAEASRRFDTTQLEREIASIESAAVAAAEHEFGANIENKHSAIRSLASKVTSLHSRVELLGRDFRQELGVLHEEKASLLGAKGLLEEKKKGLQGKHAAAKSDLHDAYEHLKEAKASIDGWYRKSDRTPWLLGNSGKKLPKHSLFGQSFGDLDEYKRQRDSAVQDIGRCKSAIANIKHEQHANNERREDNQAALARVFSGMDTVKQARQCVYDLKLNGVQLHMVEQELSDVLRQEAQLNDELRRLAAARDAFVVQQQAGRGMSERMEAVRQIKTRRSQFLASFDSSSAVAARRDAHRHAWLRERAG